MTRAQQLIRHTAPFIRRASSSRVRGAVLAARRLSNAFRAKAKGKTKTQTKSKQRTGQIHGGVGGSESRFSTHLTHLKRDGKITRVMLKETPVQTWAFQGGYQHTTSINQSLAVVPFYTLSNADVDSIRTNVILPVTGDDTALNDGARTAKFHVKSIEYEMLFTNLSNGNIRLKIYDCMYRTDTNQDPVDAWDKGILNTTGASAHYYTYPSGTPYASLRFTQNFLIKRCTDIILPAGSVHIHKGHIGVNGQFPMARESEQYNAGGTGYLSYVGNWTHFPMIVTHGFPAGNSNDVSQAVIESVKLGVVYNYKYKFSIFAPATVSHNKYQNYLAALTAGGVQETMTEEGNVVAATTFA